MSIIFLFIEVQYKLTVVATTYGPLFYVLYEYSLI